MADANAQARDPAAPIEVPAEASALVAAGADIEVCVTGIAQIWWLA